MTRTEQARIYWTAVQAARRAARDQDYVRLLAIADSLNALRNFDRTRWLVPHATRDMAAISRTLETRP